MRNTLFIFLLKPNHPNVVSMVKEWYLPRLHPISWWTLCVLNQISIHCCYRTIQSDSESQIEVKLINQERNLLITLNFLILSNDPGTSCGLLMLQYVWGGYLPSRVHRYKRYKRMYRLNGLFFSEKILKHGSRFQKIKEKILGKSAIFETENRVYYLYF